MRHARGLAGLALTLVVVSMTGCGDPKDKQIEMQQLRINELLAENDGLKGDLSMCMGDRDSLQSRLTEVELELRDCLERGAKQPVKDTGRWKTDGNVAWTNLTQGILFDPGRHALKATGRAELRKVMDEINQQFPGWDVWIIGHTDSDPIKASKDRYEDNLDLSLNRARAVFQEMMKLGVDPKRMIAGGQGEYNPVVPDQGNSAAKAKNRRVTIVAVKKPSTD